VTNGAAGTRPSGVAHAATIAAPATTNVRLVSIGRLLTIASNPAVLSGRHGRGKIALSFGFSVVSPTLWRAATPQPAIGVEIVDLKRKILWPHCNTGAALGEHLTGPIDCPKEVRIRMHPGSMRWGRFGSAGTGKLGNQSITNPAS
jgi:hypothetical protein